jgi:CDP-paratose 2-epimerase
MKILITGGCGFLGSNLAAHSLQRGDNLIVFDNLSRSGSLRNYEWLQSQGVFRFVHGDIRNANDVNRLVAEVAPEAIFHLAGQVRLHAPGAAVLYSSTNKVYGDLEQFSYRETATRYDCIERPEGFNEAIPLEFHSPYGCSKGAADQYMLDYARIFGLKTVVFRHSSMYGGRQFSTYDQGWVGWFCQQAVATKTGAIKEPFTISGNGKQVRDVLHGDDMVTLYYTALEQIEFARGQAFNVGGGVANSLSLLELFSLLEECADCQLIYTKIPPRESDQRVFVADIAKAKCLLGWEPQVSSRVGVRRMFSWVAGEAQ